ncbi:ABC transporter ATP-binding protein [Jiella marina]|uniref:ABC transporter ATP-binding protein n=1 Tax=Jiella sp. LLJ827 TaxID=2917712 RepID=UPI002100A0D0|nr:ABC transporter ATP-binding protein [Jiella sp. LLJ827]MCQ0986311.1 ABC transporter ATP-binding protein [Jiella sp. LLJ827]
MPIEVADINKHFGKLHVLRDCSLSIRDGETITLLGASGCGKTTLLRCIAGFETPSSGKVVLGGEDVTRLPPNQRGVGFVFQNYALFPHMTVAENLAYGLRVRRADRSTRKAKVEEALALVSLTEFADRYPQSLSGGQQQRVAIARALVLRPKVLLLDEAFNALDAKLRVAMQIELRKIVKQVGITTICVTHDQTEALTISDRIAVMSKGQIDQFATPTEIYDTPTTAYVADFIGAANVLPAELAAKLPSLGARGSREDRMIVIRPENLTVRPTKGSEPLAGTIAFARITGPSVEYEVEAAERKLRVLVSRADHDMLDIGTPVALDVDKADACVAVSGSVEGSA